MGTSMILSSLRVHREQREDALFFDADSPEQLSCILDGFLPAGYSERETKSSVAALQAPIKIEKFAREFAGLMKSSSEGK